MADRKTQVAVIRAYKVIGEIVKRLPKDLLDEQPSVDWRRLIRFRDFLAHNYDRLVLNNMRAGNFFLQEPQPHCHLLLHYKPLKKQRE